MSEWIVRLPDDLALRAKSVGLLSDQAIHVNERLAWLLAHQIAIRNS